MFSVAKFQPSGIVPPDGGLFGLDWSFVVDLVFHISIVDAVRFLFCFALLLFLFLWRFRFPY